MLEKKRNLEYLPINMDEIKSMPINKEVQLHSDLDPRLFIINIPEKVDNLILKNKEIDSIEYNKVIWVRDLVETLRNVEFNIYMVKALLDNEPEFEPYIFEIKILSTESKKGALVKLFNEGVNHNQNVIYQINNSSGTVFSLLQLSGDNYMKYMSSNLPECERLEKHSFLEISNTKLNGFNPTTDWVQNINDIAEHLVNTGYNEFTDIIYLGDDINDFDSVFELRTKFITGKQYTLNQFRANSMVQLTGYLTPAQVVDLKGSNLWFNPVYSTYVLKPNFYKGKNAI